MDDRLKRIVDAMNDLLQRNARCDFEIHCNGNITRIKTSSRKAYMQTWEMASENNTDAYCYMCPNGNRAARPVFNVVNGVVRLSGTVV